MSYLVPLAKTAQSYYNASYTFARNIPYKQKARKISVLLHQGLQATRKLISNTYQALRNNKLTYTCASYINTSATWAQQNIPTLLIQHNLQSLYNLSKHLGARLNPHSIYTSTALRAAIMNGNIDMVRELLDNGVDPNTTFNHGINALMMALFTGSRPIMDLLLNHGADINRRTDTGRSILFMTYQAEMIDYLIQHGADVTACTHDGNTLLHRAVVYFPQLIPTIIAHHADINAQNNQGQTPLMIACQHNALESACQLISLGADKRILDKTNHNALYYADQAQLLHHEAQDQHINHQLQELVTPRNIKEELMEAIISKDENKVASIIHEEREYFDFCAPFEDLDITPLMLAATQSTLQIVQRIVATGHNHRYTNRLGQHVLLMPIQDPDIFEFLIQNIPCINECDNQGKTVLMNAIELHGNNRNIIDALLAKNIDINAKNINGKTALIMAVELNNYSLAKVLVEHGANVNCCTNNGTTPLMIACQHNVLPIVQYLVAHKANLALQDKQHSTAFDYAKQLSEKPMSPQDHEINQKILSLVALYDIRKDLQDSLKTHNDAHVLELLKNPMLDVDELYEDATPLMIAAQYSTPDIVAQIISLGLEYNQRNSQGQNVLLLPIRNPETFFLLLSKLSFLATSSDKEGRTVLMNAIELHGANQKIMDALLDMTLRNKDYIQAQDKQGRTALMIATRLHHDYVVNRLKQAGAIR
jgi:ankyrin repeat protein